MPPVPRGAGTEHAAELFAGTPIVYCSVSGDPRPDHLSDAKIGEVMVPDSVVPTLEMMLRLHPDNPLLKRWAEAYKGKGTEGLDMRQANDLIKPALFPSRVKDSRLLGPRTLMGKL